MSEKGQGGYFLVYRKMENNPILEDDHFDKTHAWLWLIGRANFKPTKIMFDGKLITLERGQFITSIRKMASTWGWSTKKVTRFLDVLEANGMIRRESNTKKTLLTIEKYSVYQPSGNTNDHTNYYTNDHTNDLQINNKKGDDPNGTALEPSVRGLVDSEFYNFELGEPLDAYW